jgi:shikimate dehydrogenase
MDVHQKNFALIGHPVGHTMSPFIHSRLFALSGAQAGYRVLDLPPERLAASVPELRRLDGFNITIPHKQAIIPLLDGCSRKASESGSVNTVKNEGGRLVGYTTDGEGFRRALQAAETGLGGKAAVLGAGGAARAVVFELAHAGAEVTVAAREHSAGAAEKLCRDVRAAVPGARVGRCLISELRGTRDLLVNATPAGMYPKAEGCAADEEAVAGSACVFDAVYNPNETKLLALAKKHGRKAVGGVGMLVFQAAASEEIWLGSRFSEDSLKRLCADTAFEMKKKFGSVVLCGFMGSGKTTAGRLLAEKTGCGFLDLDESIEREEGMSIPEIFAKKGEAAFREMERRAVRGLSRSGRLVVAAGGGTVLDPENAAAFRANGVVVLLDAPLETVRERLKGDRSRPLLRRDGGGDRLAELYLARSAAYRAAADLAVDAGRSPEETAAAVLEALRPAT